MTTLRPTTLRCNRLRCFHGTRNASGVTTTVRVCKDLTRRRLNPASSWTSSQRPRDRVLTPLVQPRRPRVNVVQPQQPRVRAPGLGSRGVPHAAFVAERASRHQTRNPLHL